MLQSLEIKNYALIEHLSIDFDGGFSVITGETGAGKSILLGALSLLLGARSEARMVRQGCSRLMVEGVFRLDGMDLEPLFRSADLDYDPALLILRREVSQDGRSRAFCNDSPVPASFLRLLSPRLIDIHSQHQNLLLENEDFQISAVDALADDADLLEAYRGNLERWHGLQNEAKGLERELEENRKQQDWNAFQLDELLRAHLQEGEQELLESEQSMLEHAEEIKGSLFGCVQLLQDEDGCVLDSLGRACQLLQEASGHLQKASPLAQRLSAAHVELKDIASEIRSMEEEVEFSPSRLEMVSGRLSLLYSLEKKHDVDSVEGLLSLQTILRDRMDSSDRLTDRLEAIKREAGALQEDLSRQAAEITRLRRQAAGRLEEELLGLLCPMALPNARFSVLIQDRGLLTAQGRDRITFLFAANRTGEMQDIRNVASGGEISRLMLALKSILVVRGGLPTVIFDEVDTGTGGETAARMAAMMRGMASERQQVLCITHLPQIASRGMTQYRVEKRETESGTVSTIVRLDSRERVREIARMLSGDSLTQAALDNAAQLLREGGAEGAGPSGALNENG